MEDTITKEKCKVSQAPDGNGGIYPALHDFRTSNGSTPIEDMRNRGVRGLMVFAVDNAVCKVGDPLFVGYCLQEDAELGVKVVCKVNAKEKVGHLVTVDGRYEVIEYTEIGEMANELNEDGTLKFNAGSVCIHYYSFDFLDKKCSKEALPKTYHIARKKIPFVKIVKEEGKPSVLERVIPEKENGYKFEIFIFDVFNLAQKVCVLEATRAEEFGPVKNKDEPNAVGNNPN